MSENPNDPQIILIPDVEDPPGWVNPFNRANITNQDLKALKVAVRQLEQVCKNQAERIASLEDQIIENRLRNISDEKPG